MLSTGVIVFSGAEVISATSTVLSGAILTAGEQATILTSGTAVSTVVGNGAATFVLSGGLADASQLSGGDEIVLGGTASGAMV